MQKTISLTHSARLLLSMLLTLLGTLGCVSAEGDPPVSAECLGTVCGDECCTGDSFCATDYHGRDYCESLAEPPPPCPEELVCGEACCDEGESCNEGVCGPALGPDLILLEEGTAGTVQLSTQTFEDETCEVVNRCVKRAGEREVLEFGVVIQNIGSGDFILPAEQGNTPICGERAQYEGIVQYEVIDSVGTVVLSGDVQTTCVANDEGGRFTCDSELGLSAGSQSEALGAATCPMLDATNMPAGDYGLRLKVNPEGALVETDLSNNELEVPFNIACRTELCGGVCCPEGKCEEGTCMLPDLHVLEERTTQSIIFTTEFFAEESCEIFEGCIVQPGERRLMRFDTTTPNSGEADLFLGVPEENIELFDYSPCHDHFHFESYAKYRLLDEEDNVVADGHKQAFCLIDTDNLTQENPGPNYNCSFQGITKGWADTYNSGLDCQWVDVTGVPPGDYILEQRINSEWVLDELDFTNNISTVSVTIPEDPNACIPSEEVCGDGIDNNCDSIVDNDCPPLTDNTTCESAREMPRNGVYFADIAPGAGTSISSCGGTGNSVYFRMGLPSDEIVYFSTYGSEIDTTLTVYKDDCGSVEEVCSDDGCDSLQSHIGRKFVAGNYFVEVRSKTDAGGLIKLHAERAFCGNADAIDGLDFVDGDTTEGLNESAPEECNEGGNGNEAMYFFTTCPGTTDVAFNTCEAEFDTMLEVREGSCSGSDAVECNDDGRCGGDNRFASELESELYNTKLGGEGDGLWFIMLDGYQNNSNGPFRLNIAIGADEEDDDDSAQGEGE